MRYLTSGDAPTFRVWIHDPLAAGTYAAAVGLTGQVESDFNIYAAAPGASLPGSPIADTDYVITDRGRGYYDIAFSATSYFTGAGPSSFSIEWDDGIYTGPLLEVLYYVGAAPADVRAWLGTAPVAPNVAGVPKVDITHHLGSASPLVTKLDAIDDFVDTEVAAIKAKTDNLPTDPADASDIAALIDALPTAVEIDAQLTASHGAGSWAVTAANVVDALMAYSHDTGVTVKGFLRRVDAMAAGKATGLRGGLAKYFRRGGVLVAISAIQDVLTGTRNEADVTQSES